MIGYEPDHECRILSHSLHHRIICIHFVLCGILTHWGRVMHICVSKLTIIGSDNGLLPGWRQAIIWTNAGILLIEPLGINFNEIAIKIHAFSFKNIHLKMASGKWHPFCLCLNVLTHLWPTDAIWRHRSGSTLVQVMAWCLMATSHYLNQCWLILNEVLWQSLPWGWVHRKCSRWSLICIWKLLN